MVGDGNKTKFWHDVFVGSTSLCVEFERLFSVSKQKPHVVGSLGSWKGMSGFGPFNEGGLFLFGMRSC